MAEQDRSERSCKAEMTHDNAQRVFEDILNDALTLQLKGK